MEYLTEAAGKNLHLEHLEDEILKGCVITHQGEVVNEAIK